MQGKSLCLFIAGLLLCGVLFWVYPHTVRAHRADFISEWLEDYSRYTAAQAADNQADLIYLEHLAAAARMQVGVTTGYDPRYVQLSYPEGDVPKETGVCTDVVIRAYRMLNVDLQRLVHEDMARNFSRYPQLWGLRSPDTSIDHRRVPNLMQFFRRKGAQLPIAEEPTSYRDGDIVAWDLGSGVTHIGIVYRLQPSARPLIIHNIGHGVKIEDVLDSWKKIGVFRYVPKRDAI